MRGRFIRPGDPYSEPVADHALRYALAGGAVGLASWWLWVQIAVGSGVGGAVILGVVALTVGVAAALSAPPMRSAGKSFLALFVPLALVSWLLYLSIPG